MHKQANNELHNVFLMLQNIPITVKYTKAIFSYSKDFHIEDHLISQLNLIHPLL